MDFQSSDEGSPSEIPTRPMRVKVLYSFDKDNKDNCLARFPNTLQIPAVAINESSQVGVIELRQCIQSIVSASPELVSRLSDGDFTIYAYDYSEYETPLVGQGLLSAILAAASPMDGEKNMITGRVCKNIPALFSNGVKETLEVKLRLVPIAKPAQPAVVQKIETMRGMSPATSAGFDPNAWSASMRPQPHQNDYFDFGTSVAGSEADMAMVDEMLGLGPGSGGTGSGQQVMGGVGMAETPTDPAYAYNPAFSHSAPGSRAGSPMMGSDAGLHNEHLRHQSFSAAAPSFSDQSRPVSRASARSEVQSTRPRQTSQQPSQHQEQPQQVEVYYNEDGQPRKRAKVMQADWRGKSSFGAKRGNLRVTAATAHSMQMHRPVAKRPGVSGSDLEPPPRAPTPVPQRHPLLPRQQSTQPTQSRSLLRQASTVSMQSDFMSDADQFSDAIMSSPEDDRSPTHSYTADGTPPDMPSSPPIFPGVNAPEPSSPGLPTLPKRAIDSGYMSEPLFPGSMVDNYDDDNEDRSPDARDLEDAAQYRARSQQPQTFIKSEGPYPSDLPQSEMNVSLETPGDMSQLPNKMRLNLPPGFPRERNQGPRPLKPSLPKQSTSTSISGTPYPEEAARPGPPESRRGSLALPPRPVEVAIAQSPAETQLQQPQRPQPPKRRSTKRTATEYDGSEAGSPAPSDTDSRPRGTKRSGTGAKRRMIIQQRLEAAIATGDMPTYCSHCGAIETPTWRKLYCKIVEGKPSALDEAEGEGETIQVEPLEWDESTQEVCKFRIRKSLKKTKEVETELRDYETNTVCNPCGLWFTKFRNMRPQDRWHRKPTSRKNQKKKDPDGTDGLMTDGVESQSEAFFNDQFGPDDVGHVSDFPQHNNATDGAPQKQSAPQYRPIRPRASSMQPAARRQSGGSTMNASQMSSALQRAVQSSPPMPFRGSQDSPIEVEDLTPKPVRRLLFPSPRREGEVKSLDDNGQVKLQAVPVDAPTKTMPSKIEVHAQSVDVSIFEAFTYDKENLAPDAAIDDDQADLFEGSPSNAFKTPRKTPSETTPRSKRQLEHLLKTPTPPSRKLRSALSPNANAALNATLPTATANDFMTSPSSSRYFLRSTPSRQERTPGRNSQRESVAENSLTPFSRHLAQMLSEADSAAAGADAFGTSPSKGGFDFGDLPSFGTPGKGLEGFEWEGVFEEGRPADCGGEGN
ncbi:hypothetical protein EJ03DRAFT_375963 [Teratosphaeria nubilosa]|uniref:Ams2/SPT21 N-terminal domain-containing protein n=1 Tax=Teratosphaeria nubilosa TaxID=161662 RepID=A0A6G1L526_9PEZI|nr:hypothetical protein EJ03DRAFT_375963 [Teratosphaeria nubilosa]